MEIGAEGKLIWKIKSYYEKRLLQEQNDSDILTISESVRFLIVIYEFRFGKSANAFSKFLEIIEKPRKRYYNEGGRMEKEVLQWHPAFYAGLQIELKDKEEKKRLVEEYQKHRDNKLYESVMDIVVRANQKEFEEDTGMCKALEELMADVIAKREKEAIERGMEQGIAQGMEQGMAQGREQEMRSVVSNMLKKKMSDEDICEIAECDREYVDMVRKSIA